MKKNNPIAAKSDENSTKKHVEPRAPHSIRFSDSEWSGIETEARTRGMSAAEFVRHAATSLATGRFATSSPLIPTEIAAQIERIYRGVYLLSTLTLDEMIRDGRQDECDRIRQDARDSQISIQEVATRNAR